MARKWNGTDLQTGWLRLRGAGGQSKSSPFRPGPWMCDGCHKVHGGRVERTIGSDAKNYCRGQFLKFLGQARPTPAQQEGQT